MISIPQHKKDEQAALAAATARWQAKGNQVKKVTDCASNFKTTTERQRAKTFKDVIDGLPF